jgi:imidazoleglycerol phosphate dehydratase HisB
MTGRLDANTTGRLWRDAQHVLEAIFKALGVALAEACSPA